MPLLEVRKSKPIDFGKPIEISWNSFRRGVNFLLQDTELNKEEIRAGNNMLLEGAGILNQRPGSKKYYLSGPGPVHTTIPYTPKSGTVQHLSISDGGMVVKKSGASYSVLPGASYVSGARVSGVQIYNKEYFVSLSKEMVRYDGTTLLSYVGISTPSIISATKSSGTTGAFTWSWRVSAESETGETLASNPITLANLPEYLLTTNFVTLSWTSVANSRGYVIYGRDAGNETFLARVPQTTLSFIDDGSSVSSAFVFPPEADFTAGPKAKYVIATKEKLVVAYVENNPSRVMYSGGGPNVDKFHWSKGGGYVDVAKDDGEVITGLEEGDNGKIIVFKDRSVYQITLTYNSDLGIVEPTVQRISAAIGCVSDKTILQVENDIFFLGRRAGGGVSLNSLGYEPNFTNILRTSEISARIRPEMETINLARISELHATYFANKYWFFYPVGATSMKAMAYDRERLAFVGPFNYPANPASSGIFYDENGQEHFLYGGSDGYVHEISNGYSDDDGVPFDWLFESRKESAGAPLELKNMVSYFLQLRDVIGTVNVEIIIEGKSGVTNVSKSFAITGANSLSGWGSFSFGFGMGFGSTSQASTGLTNSSEIVKFLQMNKTGIRSYKVRIFGSGSKAKIVAMKAVLTKSSQIPSSWRV